MQIYKVTNKINGKIYIGQTTKDDPNYLGSGPIIMKAVRKYGRDSFIRETIEICDSKNELNEREKYWIEFYRSNVRGIGYNISIGGNGGNLGDLVNEKISISNMGKVTVKDNCGNFYKVRMDDERCLSGELVGIKRGLSPHNKGVPMSEDQKNKLRCPKTEDHKNNLSIAAKNRQKKKILCLNNNKVYTMKEAAEELNLTIPNIIEVLKGRAEKTKGYSFSYLQD